MVLSYVQLLLVCLSFWSSKEAVARARRRQWAAALSFGGLVLLCLLISVWFLLAALAGVAVALLDVIRPPRASSPPRLLKRLDAYIQRTLGKIDDFIADFIDDIADSWHQRPLRPRRPALHVEWVSFYESGTGTFSFRFPQNTARYIMFTMSVQVRHPRRWRRRHGWRYPVVYRYYKRDGSLLREVQREMEVKDEWGRFWQSYGMGWPEPGLWTPGEYRVEILIDGVKTDTGWFTIELPLPTRPPTADIPLMSVRFYEAAAWALTTEARLDSVRFPQQTTREVICELTVRNLLYRERDRTYPVTAQCYTPEGKLLWEGHQNWLIKSEEQESSISWQWQVPGQWEAGAYRVEILIDRVEFAWGAFLVEAS